MSRRVIVVVGLFLCSLSVGVFFYWQQLNQIRTVVEKPIEPVTFETPTAVPEVGELVSIIGPPATASPGAVVVGLIDHKKQLVLGWGKDKAGHDANGDTVFETASISKAITGLMLAAMVEKGQVKLEDNVLAYSDTEYPCCATNAMSLLNLATHTSGLPPWPDNRGDTAAPYSSKNLRDYLRHATLLGPPGEGTCYSNTAFALLSDLLSIKAGLSFDALLQKTICAPLGMNSTYIGSRKADRKRIAGGHWASGETAPPSSPTASGGADGVRSTAHDLLKLLGAYIGLQHTALDGALPISYQEHFTFDDNRNAALGWFVDNVDGTVHKHGLIAGYRTTIAFSPEYRCGVVVLSGWEKFPSPEVGKKILARMMEIRSAQQSGTLSQASPFMKTIRCRPSQIAKNAAAPSTLSSIEASPPRDRTVSTTGATR